MNPTETALAFVQAINSKDVERLAELMTDDHKFIDGDGSEYIGKDRMKVGWKEHFEIDMQFEEMDTVVLVGHSRGTIIHNGKLKQENSWRVPSAWRVIVKSDKISVWQLYANQCALHEIYDRINTV